MWYLVNEIVRSSMHVNTQKLAYYNKFYPLKPTNHQQLNMDKSICYTRRGDMEKKIREIFYQNIFHERREGGKIGKIVILRLTCLGGGGGGGRQLWSFQSYTLYHKGHSNIELYDFPSSWMLTEHFEAVYRISNT